jgi:hypothetical protein
MKMKQLIVLGVVLIALFAFYSNSNKTKKVVSNDGLKAGDSLISSEKLNVNDISGLKITDSNDSVHLVREDGAWIVANRDNYKADFSKISRVLKKLIDLKVAEQLRVGPKNYSRFDLNSPAEGKAIKVDLLKGGEKQPQIELLIGKAFRGATVDSGQQAGGNGKYLRLGDNGSQVFIIEDSLYDIESTSSGWLEKSPFAIDKPKNVSIMHSDEVKFNFIRTEEGSDATLEGTGEDEELNTSNTSSIVSPFANFSFKDVVVGEKAKTENTGLDKPVQLTVSTFDGFNYKITLGKGEGENVDSAAQEASLTTATYYLSYTVEAKFPKLELQPREPQDDETLKDDASEEDKGKALELKKTRDNEDKEKQQKEYNEKKKSWQEKLEKENSFVGTIYEVDSWSAEKFFMKREDLVKKKEVEKKGDGQANPLGTPQDNKSAIPGLPGGLIPGISP